MCSVCKSFVFCFQSNKYLNTYFVPGAGLSIVMMSKTYKVLSSWGLQPSGRGYQKVLSKFPNVQSLSVIGKGTFLKPYILFIKISVTFWILVLLSLVFYAP